MYDRTAFPSVLCSAKRLRRKTKPPKDLHSRRLREKPPGHLIRVPTLWDTRVLVYSHIEIGKHGNFRLRAAR